MLSPDKNLLRTSRNEELMDPICGHSVWFMRFFQEISEVIPLAHNKIKHPIFLPNRITEAHFIVPVFILVIMKKLKMAIISTLKRADRNLRPPETEEKVLKDVTASMLTSMSILLLGIQFSLSRRSGQPEGRTLESSLPGKIAYM